MNTLIRVSVIGSILTWVAGAQEPSKPALRKGVSVQMAVANHAVEMRAADEPDAMVVAITANGEVYSGVQHAEPTALSRLSEETVYLKADAGAPFQTVLTVLDALRGKTVVLLSASPASAKKAPIVAPYGLKVGVMR